ncbi:CDP-glycerol glycerophosphotransferase family protein [Rhizorhapis sp. SPR117]|uniref:CDP-glycerol glycerophosphotransferase family protein n=1 Tax=Rhizorhapis sp. SPR117 TaxID=2912611 RepID=UPI0030C7EFDC
MTKIAFLAISEAHQIFHWLPVALRLARDFDVKVSVLSSSRAISEFISSYDDNGLLEIVQLRRPPFSPDSLFRLPSRFAVLLLNYRTIASFRYIVTTEVSSGHLKKFPGFASKMIQIKHGAGDRSGGYRKRHDAYDLTLVAGEKDKERLIEKGLVRSDNCQAAGYSKFEMMAPPQRFFDNDQPVVLYNPHFDRRLSSWFNHEEELLRCFETITDFNFIVAPHVKMKADLANFTTNVSNIRIDLGSRHSIDMSYTNSADIYLGDVSSQVYEFIRQPRPCLFLNLDHIAWCNDPDFLHWHMGQVVEQLSDLPSMLRQAAAVQVQYSAIQIEALHRSVSENDKDASMRQAEIIMEFIDKDRSGKVQKH